MKKQLEQVKEWHESFNVPVLKSDQLPPIHRVLLRLELVKEEFKELKEAHESGNIEHIAKEACDLLYVVLGGRLEFGYYADLKTVFHIVPNNIETLERWVDYFLKYASPDAFSEIEYALLAYLKKAGLSPYFDRCFDEVHRSNMSKLDDNGKPIYREDGKALKGPNYSPADLSFLTEVTKNAL